MTAMITPFDLNGQLDPKKTEELAFRLSASSDTLVLTGTTGESPTLTHHEEREIYSIVKKAVGSKVKIVAGTGSNDTRTAIEATQQAEKLGVDGAMIVVPYYNKPSQEGMLQHFKAVAQNTGLPIIIYNIPGRTGVNMQVDTALELAGVSNIVAMKEASGNLEQITQLIQKVPKSFLVYSGDDALTLDVVRRGGAGVISVASHFVGAQIKEMIALAKKSEFAAAEKINQTLSELFRVLFITSNPAPTKAAFEMLGFPVGGLRLPLVMPSDSEKKMIHAALKNLNLLS